MMELRIVWQRLVENGATCPRCGSTGAEVERAYKKLRKALKPLGIGVVLETREMGQAAFRADTSQSNRIWIAGKPLEEWLQAETGQSPCCDTCGDAQCRTVRIGSSVYEAIPEALIIRAGLLAAAGLLQGRS